MQVNSRVPFIKKNAVGDLPTVKQGSSNPQSL